MGIVQIALDPPPPPPLCKTGKRGKKVLQTILASPYTPQAKVGQKVLQTILVSLYTRPPFGQWTFGNNTLQKGDSRRCRAYKNFLKHLILADYSKNICRRGIFVQSSKINIVCCLSPYSLWIIPKWNTVSIKRTHSPKGIQISPRGKYFSENSTVCAFMTIVSSWLVSLSDPSGTDLSLVFSPPPSPSRPVSDYYYKCPIYCIQALGSPQPIHFLKAHDVSSPNTDENTNTKTKTVTKTMTKTKTPREWLKQ